MAKKSAKTQRKPRFDAAGWLFWAVVFFVLVGPAIYGASRITAKDAMWLVPVAMGVVSAALGAGFVSWAVNGVIQRRVRKRRLAERKRSKKK